MQESFHEANDTAVEVVSRLLVRKRPGLRPVKQAAQYQALEELLLLLDLKMWVVIKQFAMTIEFLMRLTQTCFDLFLQLGGEVYLSSQMGILCHNGDLVWMVFAQTEQKSICQWTKQISLPLDCARTSGCDQHSSLSRL